VRVEAWCSRCDHDFFLTSKGVGRLYWDGRTAGTADHVSLDCPDPLARIETSVFCVSCKLEHAPRILIDRRVPLKTGPGSEVEPRA
jgi:hypothetical protein